MNPFYPQKYPVFEADQVLSQNHLNQIVTYLDNQDKLTRNGALGIGILCGMKISFPDAVSVHITCGQAITSLGYMMDVEAATFTHYHDIVLPKQFLNPDLSVEPYLKKIFDFAIPYQAFEECIELLESASDAGGKQQIPADFFENKVIIQLLQVELIDQKNCIGTNCDDKGKRMEFKVRTLLLTEEQAEAFGIEENASEAVLPHLHFPRYNVPYKTLSNPKAVLDAFKKAFDDVNVLKIADAISNCYQMHKGNIDNQPFHAILDNADTLIKNVFNANQNSVKVQYLWDWLSDITEAYNEIAHVNVVAKTKCCVDEALFPFHVVVGAKDSDVRTPFYPVHDIQNSYKEYQQRLNTLFHRLVLILKHWNIDGSDIRITPSRIGDVSLSQKSIPFYYNNFNTLLENWDAGKEMGNRNDDILAYKTHAAQQPLLNDLESYNFFRIEGHIGDKYKTALQNIELLKKTYNLPFHLTALNAVDSKNLVMDIGNFQGRWDDLETDYDIARKRIFNITEFVIKWIENKKASIISQKLLTDATITQLKTILSDIKATLPDDLYEFLPDHEDFITLFKELNSIFLLHRFCIQLGNSELSMIAEDLIDRFDDINELFLEDPLTVIHDEALLRWERVYKELFFSGFMQKHSGLEHKAGVSRGGTFVLVYVDNSVFKKKTKPQIFKPILASVSLYKKSLNISSAQLKEVDDAMLTQSFLSKKKIVKPVVSDPCKDEVEKVKTNILDMASLNISNQVSSHIHDMLLGNLKQAIDITTFFPPKDATFEGLVIADFYLPYTLSGNTTTIEIKIDPVETVSIEMDKTTFCSSNNTLQEIFVTGKAGGVFAGSAKNAVSTANGKHHFNPAHISVQDEKTYNLTYQVDDLISNALEIRIEKPDEVKWIAISDKQNKRNFIFENQEAGDTSKYEFDFDDNTEPVVTKDPVVMHEFAFSQLVKEFKVLITQKGKVCDNKQIITIKMQSDFSDNDFNDKDFLTK